MDGLYVFLAIAFTVLVFAFIAAYMIFHRVSVRKKPRKPDIYSIFSKNKIDMIGEQNMIDALKWIDDHITGNACIESHDSLKLHCSLIDVEKGTKAKGVVIACHGYGSFGARDFCHQLPMIHEAGYNIMLIDQRTHAKSDGKYICYGTKECHDVFLWRKKATEIYGAELPIALFGLSMGGSTVLMASGLMDKDDAQLKCIVADCPFYDAYGIIKHVLWKYYKIYPQPIIHFVNFWSRFLANFNMHAPSCVDMAKKSSLPILMFHGKEDKYVPTSCSVRIANELGDRAKLILIDGAQHAESVYYQKELYKKELISFLTKYMQ